MLVHACLKIIGRDGYTILIDDSLKKARYFAELINVDADFELISEPELCLLTYRYVPSKVQAFLAHCDAHARQQINECLNELTQVLQKQQRETGHSFVSRTRLTPHKYDGQDTIVFRVVLANPLTSYSILQDVLTEQKALAATQQPLLEQLHSLIGEG